MNTNSPRQPTCPACRSADLKLEDAATGRHQCDDCGWRCVVTPDGRAIDWLNLGRNRAALLPVPSKAVSINQKGTL